MSEEEYKIVHARIYRPHSSLFKANRNDKAECFVISCCNSENCNLYSRGECCFLAPFGWHRCPYGRCNTDTGFTKRARKYYTWIKEKEKNLESMRGN